jgi:hypothetical protein
MACNGITGAPQQLHQTVLADHVQCAYGDQIVVTLLLK